MRLRYRLTIACLLASLPAPAAAQTTPFLTDAEIRMLSNEISGDRSFETIRVLTQWHRDSGMEGYFKAAAFMVDAAKGAGLQEVAFIEQPLEGPGYTARSAELWLVEPVEVKLADIGDHAVYLADGSHDANVTAEVVFIGDGSEAAVRDLDVRGKIVLTSGSASTAVRTAVNGKGAVGVISYVPSESKSPMDFPDQIGWTRIPAAAPGQRGTFAFNLSPRKGDALRQLLSTSMPQDVFATGTKAKGGRAVVRARVDTEISDGPGRSGFVEAWIRGTRFPDQQIIVTAHLQEEQGSANDDGSGSGNILEVGRVLTKLIAEGKLPRPLRDIRFWWTDEIYSEYRWFRDHPADVGKVLANVHQDMVGAKQSMGSRVQHLIHNPFSRMSYLDAIYESIGTYLVQTNNGYLAASRQGGLPRPHTRPIYSTRGTREGYNARFVPWFGSSDHFVFQDFGHTAVAAINWDDFWIHSSEDDLFQVDPTQLARNTFLTAATVLVLAYAEPSDVPLIAGETYSQGARRLARDLEVAMRQVAGPGQPSTQQLKDAALLIEQGIQREVRAINSARVFAAGDQRATATIDALERNVRVRERPMADEVAAFVRARTGAAPPQAALSAAEAAAHRKVPRNVASWDTYFTKRDAVPASPGLHGLMRREVFHFVDGRRSYYDIYRAVRAEALVAGAWYYWTVGLEDVVSLLDAGVKAGALELR